MVCSCGGWTRSSTWETVDGDKHYAETCNACGRYHRLASVKVDDSVCTDAKEQKQPVS